MNLAWAIALLISRTLAIIGRSGSSVWIRNNRSNKDACQIFEAIRDSGERHMQAQLRGAKL